MISGGSSDLKAKAKKWDENMIRKLKDKRTQLQEELRNLHMNSKRELDVEMKRNQITHLESRLKFTEQEIKKFEKQIHQQEVDYESASNEPDTISARIENRRVEIEQRQGDIDKLEREKGKIQDELFAQFCNRIGIQNIRYEINK